MRTDTNVDQRQVALLDTSTAVALVVEDHEAHVAKISIFPTLKIPMFAIKPQPAMKEPC